MVQIKLTFDSLDAALVALAKMQGNPAAVIASPAAPRKPRDDKGKPRGEYKLRDKEAKAEGASAPAVTTAASTAAPSAAPSAEASEPKAATPAPSSKAAPSPAPAAPAVAAPEQKAAELALEELFNKKGMKAAQDTLARFGLKRLKDILPEQRADFIAACKAALA